MIAEAHRKTDHEHRLGKTLRLGRRWRKRTATQFTNAIFWVSVYDEGGVLRGALTRELTADQMRDMYRGARRALWLAMIAEVTEWVRVRDRPVPVRRTL